ncbi:unnamed protein product [Arctogadus glacialis]
MDKEVETTAREGGSGRGAGPHATLSAAVEEVRRQPLDDLLERVGVAACCQVGKDVTDRIPPGRGQAGPGLLPRNPGTSFGRRMLLFLSSHRDFDSLLEKNIPTKDLSTARKAVSGLKAKGQGQGLGETPQTPASLPGSGTVRASTLQRKLPKPTVAPSPTTTTATPTNTTTTTPREPKSKYSSKPQGPFIRRQG